MQLLFYPPFEASERLQQVARQKPYMMEGEIGLAVSLIRLALFDLGFEVEGMLNMSSLGQSLFDEKMTKTVRAFQTANLLKADGIIGPHTMITLDWEMFALKGTSTTPKKETPKPVTSPIDEEYQLGTGKPFIKHDPGAGAHDSKPYEASYIAMKGTLGYYLVPPSNVLELITGPNAVKHMRHYFLNSGDPYVIDLEDMIVSSRTATGRFNAEIRQAKLFAQKLSPGTYQIHSKKVNTSYNYKEETTDWFFAIGGYSTWGEGNLIVTEGADGVKSYQLDFTYKFEDMYNWDGGKKVELVGITITDEFMGEFHRQGLAKEFLCTGQVRRQLSWKHGERIPDAQKRGPGGR